MKAVRSALIIAAVVAAGCSGGGSSESTAAIPLEPLSSVDPLFTLPLDGALALRVPHNAHAFDVLLDDALDRCVSSQGVEYDQPERVPPASNWQHERRYGPMRIEEATRFGYQAPPSGVNSDELIDFQRNLPLDVLEALYGPDDSGGGCLDQVGEEIALRSDPRWDDFAFIEELSNSTLRRSLEDSRLIEAMADWARCVEDRTGQTFSHPAEATAQYPSEEGEPSQEEIDAAVSDVECKHETRLIEIWAEVETELQLQLLEDHADAVADATSLAEQLLESAG